MQTFNSSMNPLRLSRIHNLWGNEHMPISEITPLSFAGTLKEKDAISISRGNPYKEQRVMGAFVASKREASICFMHVNFGSNMA